MEGAVSSQSNPNKPVITGAFLVKLANYRDQPSDQSSSSLYL